MSSTCIPESGVAPILPSSQGRGMHPWSFSPSSPQVGEDMAPPQTDLRVPRVEQLQGHAHQVPHTSLRAEHAARGRARLSRDVRPYPGRHSKPWSFPASALLCALLHSPLKDQGSTRWEDSVFTRHSIVQERLVTLTPTPSHSPSYLPSRPRSPSSALRRRSRSHPHPIRSSSLATR